MNEGSNTLIIYLVILILNICRKAYLYMCAFFMIIKTYNLEYYQNYTNCIYKM